jgi:hypothetical protein
LAGREAAIPVLSAREIVVKKKSLSESERLFASTDEVANALMKRMPTANMPCCYFLHYFQLLGDPVLFLAPVLKYAEFLEQRFRLFCIHIQRYMRILHTFLLENFGGIERTEERNSGQ